MGAFHWLANPCRLQRSVFSPTSRVPVNHVEWKDCLMPGDAYTQHNEEAKQVWDAYRTGRPVRVPVRYCTDTRFFLLNEETNPQGITFEQYSTDAETMMQAQLHNQEWRALNVALCCDDQAGPPQQYEVTVDLQRYFDAAFFGAEVLFRPGQTPDVRPLLAGDRKNLLFDQGLPDPLTGGIFAQAHRLYDAMAERVAHGLTFRGCPVTVTPFGLDTDGPLTVATNLRGAELYTDLYEDPEYVHHLLDLIVAGTIARIKAHRRFFGLPEVSAAWFYADDAVAMVSGEMVREFVLPAHRRLKQALTTAEHIGIHLCGDATRHFRLFRDEMGVYSFDTGFPVDHGWLRRELGPEVEIAGGVRVQVLQAGSPEEVTAEARRILQSGVMEGGRFILQEANDVAPGTPLRNLAAMYEAARIYGRYE